MHRSPTLLKFKGERNLVKKGIYIPVGIDHRYAEISQPIRAEYAFYGYIIGCLLILLVLEEQLMARTVVLVGPPK